LFHSDEAAVTLSLTCPIASSLETVFAMPPQEVRVRVVGRTSRYENSSGLVDDGTRAGFIVDMP
jgi:hypothetical protein